MKKVSQLYPGFGADLLSGRLLRRIRKHAKRLRQRFR